MLQRVLLALALAAGVSSAAQAQVADVVPVCGSSSGVATPVGTGGRLTRDVNGSLCVAGIAGGSGGGGTGGTVTQGAAAPDTAGNRWPVLAYQGGTWSFGLSGPIPTGSNVIGAVTQSGGPWTVSGTVAATQSGTWTVGQGAAGGTAWKVDGSGVTQPVSAAFLPLPTGAATSANQTTEITALQSLVAGTKIVAAFPYTDTTAPLAANGTYTGATRNTGTINSNAIFAYVSATFFADQAGTAYLEQSLDASTWYPLNGTAGTALTAGASVVVKAPLTMNIFRVRFTNGATAQSKFAVGSMISVN